MEPILRVATERDLEVVLGFMQQYYAFDHLVFDEANAASAVRQLIGDDRLGVIWLICEGPTPVGYIVLTFGYTLEYHGRNAFIDEFFLQPSHRGRGWGRHTLRAVETACRGFGLRAIHLEVTRTNKSVQELYRKLGFRDHDRYLMTKRID